MDVTACTEESLLRLQSIGLNDGLSDRVQRELREGKRLEHELCRLRECILAQPKDKVEACERRLTCIGQLISQVNQRRMRILRKDSIWQAEQRAPYALEHEQYEFFVKQNKYSSKELLRCLGTFLNAYNRVATSQMQRQSCELYLLDRYLTQKALGNPVSAEDVLMKQESLPRLQEAERARLDRMQQQHVRERLLRQTARLKQQNVRIERSKNRMKKLRGEDNPKEAQPLEKDEEEMKHILTLTSMNPAFRELGKWKKSRQPNRKRQQQSSQRQVSSNLEMNSQQSENIRQQRSLKQQDNRNRDEIAQQSEKRKDTSSDQQQDSSNQDESGQQSENKCQEQSSQQQDNSNQDVSTQQSSKIGRDVSQLLFDRNGDRCVEICEFPVQPSVNDGEPRRGFCVDQERSRQGSPLKRSPSWATRHNAVLCAAEDGPRADMLPLTRPNLMRQSCGRTALADVQNRSPSRKRLHPLLEVKRRQCFRKLSLRLTENARHRQHTEQKRLMSGFMQGSLRCPAGQLQDLGHNCGVFPFCEMERRVISKLIRAKRREEVAHRRCKQTLTAKVEEDSEALGDLQPHEREDLEVDIETVAGIEYMGQEKVLEQEQED